MKHLNRIKKLALTFLSSLLFAASANSAVELSNGTQMDDPVAQIVGGSIAQKNEFPFMVALIKYGFHQYCGASIINATHLLTAAHCVEYSVDSPSRIEAVVGAHRMSQVQDNQKITVSKITIHPKYESFPYLVHDIAILKLSESISANFTPIRLASSNSDSKPGTIATVAGWGLTSFGGEDSDVLRKVDLPITTLNACRIAYDENSILNSMLCAGFKQGGRDSCQQDSGGPLSIKKGNGFTQIGIVSHGFECAEPGIPGVYTKVSSYINFIKNNAGNVGFGINDRYHERSKNNFDESR